MSVSDTEGPEKIQNEEPSAQAVSKEDRAPVAAGFGVFIDTDGQTFLITDPETVVTLAQNVQRPVAPDEIRRSVHDVEQYLLVKRITDAIRATLHG